MASHKATRMSTDSRENRGARRGWGTLAGFMSSREADYRDCCRGDQTSKAGSKLCHGASSPDAVAWTRDGGADGAGHLLQGKRFLQKICFQIYHVVIKQGLAGITGNEQELYVRP